MCTMPMDDRVKSAKEETWIGLTFQLNSLGIDPESVEIYIRNFKHEEILEIWAKDTFENTFILFKTYPFCTNSGHLGPKLKEGDGQIPEGVYQINRFNPKSQFHLSLGLNYPNKADLVFADQQSPGSDIFIHGKCSSVGCIAIGDHAIKELYTIASITVAQLNSIRVDIFPYKFNSNPQIDQEISLRNHSFWNNLKTVYFDFEETKEIGAISISESGEYIVI